MFIKKIFLIIAVNIISLYVLYANTVGKDSILIAIVLGLLAAGFLTWVNLVPIKKSLPSKRLYLMYTGCELLKLFLVSVTATIIIQCWLLYRFWPIPEELTKVEFWLFIFGIIYAVCSEAIIFWNGISRVYVTSVQLGIKHRILGAAFGFILGVNIYYLNKIIKICLDEVEFEARKIEVNKGRALSEICKTKYPILLVHGVFFRDFRYLNYWGRVPKELEKNGAKVYYGEQQSAGTVESCAIELANKIETIIKETGCEKVNIIAHSKGGLDSRVAITQFGSAPYVASLTTINTPHRGCIFSEYLMGKAPNTMKDYIANKYNTALRNFGDKEPDFIGAVMDLSATKCKERNEVTPNVEGVLYESVMSYCNKAWHGRFPINVSYNVVKYFDGKNDGLVSVESAKWGSSFTLLEPKGKRGISHGDLIDLNRENIKDFDVREFYVGLVSSLKLRGY